MHVSRIGLRVEILAVDPGWATVRETWFISSIPVELVTGSVLQARGPTSSMYQTAAGWSNGAADLRQKSDENFSALIPV